MPIRPATFANLPAIAAVSAKAFYDDELFGDLMHPHRAEYPDDYLNYFVKRQRENWWDWNHVLYVATIEEEAENGGKREVIAGVAEWELMGSVRQGKELSRWDPRSLLKPTAHQLNTLSFRVYPNRAANPSVGNVFYASFPFFKHHWSGARKNSYYLDLLAVLPEYQGRGLAKELVQWGLKKAEEEGVCASVVASDTGEEFYKKVGFTTAVGMATEGEGNPLNGLRGGLILFRDPPSQERS